MERVVDFIEFFEALGINKIGENSAQRVLAYRLARHAGLDAAMAEATVEKLEKQSMHFYRPAVVESFGEGVMQRGGFDQAYVHGVLGQVYAELGYEKQAQELFSQAGWRPAVGSPMAVPEGKVFDADGFPAKPEDPLEILVELKKTK